MSTCPITRSEIEPNDEFRFKTKSGKVLKYSGRALRDYVEFSKKLVCPLTRERFSTEDLTRLGRLARREISFLPNLKRFWVKINNSSVRSETKLVVLGYIHYMGESSSEEFDRLNHAVSMLILLTEIVNMSAVRSFMKRIRRMPKDEVIARRIAKLDLLFEVLSEHVTVQKRCYLSEAEFDLQLIDRNFVPGLVVGSLPSFVVKLGAAIPPSVLQNRGRGLLNLIE